MECIAKCPEIFPFVPVALQGEGQLGKGAPGACLGDGSHILRN